MLIGIGGKLAAGKDTVADYYVDEADFMKLGMSDPLHQALMTLNQWIYVTPEERHSTGLPVAGGYWRYAWLTHQLGYTAAKTIDEYRKALQLLGTDVARDQWGDDHWVNVARHRIKNLRQAGRHVILTGIRFENEAALIHELGGTLMWVSRTAPSTDTPVAQAVPSTQAHVSEAMDGSTFDVQVANTGTLDELYAAARIALGAIHAGLAQDGTLDVH